MGSNHTYAIMCPMPFALSKRGDDLLCQLHMELNSKTPRENSPWILTETRPWAHRGSAAAFCGVIFYASLRNTFSSRMIEIMRSVNWSEYGCEKAVLMMIDEECDFEWKRIEWRQS